MTRASKKLTLERFRKAALNQRITLTETNFDTIDEEISHIRTLLNGAFYTNAATWMLPRWAIRYFEKNERSSIDETGLANTIYRNWVNIGGVGAKCFGISDSRGLLTARIDTGSSEVWLLGPDGMIFPALGDESDTLTLLSPEDQVYEWKKRQGSVELTRLIYHVSENDSESIYDEVSIQNFDLDSQTFSFVYAIRPISVLGVEPIESIDFDQANGHIFINGVLACVLDGTPSAVVMTTADNPNLSDAIRTGDRIDSTFSTPKGLGTVLLRFDIKPNPAGSVQMFFANPLQRIEKGASIPEFTLDSRARDESVEKWFTLAGRRLAGAYPNEHLAEVLSQAKANLVMRSYSSLTEFGSNVTHKSCIEQARILHALAISGSEPLASELPLLVAEESLNSSSLYDPACVATMLWAVLQTFEHNEKSDYMTELTPFIDFALYTVLIRVRQLLIPETPSISEEIPPSEPIAVEDASIDDLDEEDPIVVSESPPPKEETPPWIDEIKTDIQTALGDASIEDDYDSKIATSSSPMDDFLELLWIAASLKSTSLALKDANALDRISALDRLLLRLYESLSKKADIITQSEISPETALKIISSISLVGASGTDLSSIESESVRRTRNSFRRGLFRFEGPPELISSHHTLRLAHYYAQKHQRYEAEELLNKSLECISEQNVFPEYVNVKTWGGSFGDGSCVSASADLIILIRSMLLYEDNENLILLPGIPEEWYTSTTMLTVNGFPTRLGPIDLELGSSKNQHQVEVRVRHLPKEIELHVPHSFSISLAKVFGGAIIGRYPDEESPRLRIVPLSDRIVFTFHR